MKTVIQRVIIQTKKFVVLGLIAASVLAGALLAQAGDRVPFHSTVTGVAVLDNGKYLIHEVGIGTHIGMFTSTGILGENYDINSYIVTAANGDQFFCVGYFDPSNNTLYLYISGGTGRFESSTGQLTAPVIFNLVDPPTWAYTGTETGWISTVGSNKKK
jgi:hypothetical protein